MEKRVFMKSSRTKLNYLAAIHGFYYLVTGIWPVLHIDSFMAVTGPKADIWLVRTVGMLAFFIGTGLIAAAIKKQVTLPLFLIAAGSALGFILIDVFYVWHDVILAVYLADALIELILLIYWLVLMFKPRQQELF